MIIFKNWNNINNSLNKGIKEKKRKIFPIQCAFSNDKQIQTFVLIIFIKFIKVMYISLYTITSLLGLFEKNTEKRVDFIKKVISSLFLAEYVEQNNNIFIHKPGINFNQSQSDFFNNLIDDFANKNPQNLNEIIKNKYKSIPMSVLIGSLYGNIVNGGIYLITFLAQYYNSNIKKIINMREEIIIDRFRNMFGVPDEFSEADFILFLESVVGYLPFARVNDNVSIVRRFKENQLIYGETVDRTSANILLDLYLEDFTGISGRNFKDKDYLRLRMGRDIHTPLKGEPAPQCPNFVYEKSQPITLLKEIDNYYDKVFITYGNQWYPVPKTSIQRYIFNQYKKSTEVNAGYSGSTIMWLSFLKYILNIDIDDPYIKKIILCMIVSDFVPIFHSLPEILVVFSQELEPEEKRYTLDINPALYLYSYLNDPKIDWTKSNNLPIIPIEEPIKKLFLNWMDEQKLKDFIREQSKIINTTINYEVKKTRSKIRLPPEFRD